MHEFDLMVHLVGEQPIPNLLAMRQFDVPRHLLLASKQTVPVAERVQQLQEGETTCAQLKDPYAIGTTSWQIVDCVRKSGAQRPVFNLTGGTKMMFAAAYDAARELNAPCIYVETIPAPTLHWMEPHREEPLKPVLWVEDFIRAAGHEMQDPGLWESVPERSTRAGLARRFWGARSRVGDCQGAFADCLREIEKRAKRGESALGELLPRFPAWVKAELDGEGRGTLTVDAAQGEFAGARDVADFMAGGWFEEYCYALLRPFERKGRVRDLRIRLRPAWDAEAERTPDATGIQEFDLAFTDGFRLFVVECKAGKVQQQHIQVLENNARKFGGIMGQGILLAAHDLGAYAFRRIQGARVAAIAGESLPSVIGGAIFTIRPGTILPAPRTKRRPPSA